MAYKATNTFLCGYFCKRAWFYVWAYIVSYITCDGNMVADVLG